MKTTQRLFQNNLYLMAVSPYHIPIDRGCPRWPEASHAVHSVLNYRPVLSSRIDSVAGPSQKALIDANL